MAQDLYSRLGVERGATPEQIKNAFRRLVLIHHPDVSQRADADVHFQQLHAAYACLIDPDRRREHDRAIAPRGEDLEVELWVESWEKFARVTRIITVPVVSWCPACDGTGRKRAKEVCSDCVEAAALCDAGADGALPRCPACGCEDAEGQCDACGGAGRVTVTKDLPVSLPRGIGSVETLKLPEAGHAGPRNGRPGDAIVTIRLRSTPNVAQSRSVVPLWG